MAGWTHSPAHHLEEAGAYMVTAGTDGQSYRTIAGFKTDRVKVPDDFDVMPF